MLELQPVKSLADQVYDVLRQAILSGRFQPGQRLVETHLAAQTGFSRTPIREALKRLAAAGLVRGVPRRGMVVSSFSSRELEELFAVRMVLETYAVRLAAERISEPQLRELESIWRACARALRVGGRRSAEVGELSRRFHNLIDAGAGNRVLAEAMAGLRDRMTRYQAFIQSGQPEMAESLAGHEAILEALRRRDPALAEQRVLEHGQQKREVGLRHLRALETAREIEQRSTGTQ